MSTTLAVLAALLFLAPSVCSARVFVSRSQALREAFPDAESVQAHDLFLTPEEKREVESAAGARMDSALATLYEGQAGGRSLGVALLDTQVVRTMPETLLVVLGPDGRVTRTVMCAFSEPEDYLPTRRWFTQFEGKGPGAEFRVGRDVAAVAGSTLTAQAVAVSVRRTLALRTVWLRHRKAGL